MAKKSPGRVTADDLATCVYSPDDKRETSLSPYENKQIADKKAGSNGKLCQNQYVRIRYRKL